MRGPRSGVLKTPLREIRLRAERRQKAINSHKKGGKPQQLAASRNRSRETGEPFGTVRLDQPRVTTGGGGALPFPQMAHPLTPMARTIEQTAIRNFFMTLPVCTQCVCTASKSLSGCISATYSKLRLWSWSGVDGAALTVRWSCTNRNLLGSEGAGRLALLPHGALYTWAVPITAAPHHRSSFITSLGVRPISQRANRW